jgi:hypothetical protein
MGGPLRVALGIAGVLLSGFGLTAVYDYLFG